MTEPSQNFNCGHSRSPENTYIHAARGTKICKTCQRASSLRYYHANPNRYKKTREIERASRQKYIYELKDKPCADCGNKYPPVVMDFDHVRGTKLSGVSELVSNCRSWDAILIEIAKCDLVCANCHRIRTHRTI